VDVDRDCGGNWDCPDALHTKELIADLKRLRNGEEVEVPVYDFAVRPRPFLPARRGARGRAPAHAARGAQANARATGEGIRQQFQPGTRGVLLVEGLMAFHDQELRNAMDMRIYVDCDEDTRFMRRLARDTHPLRGRGRTVADVYSAWARNVKPNHHRCVFRPALHRAAPRSCASRARADGAGGARARAGAQLRGADQALRSHDHPAPRRLRRPRSRRAPPRPAAPRRAPRRVRGRAAAEAARGAGRGAGHLLAVGEDPAQLLHEYHERYPAPRPRASLRRVRGSWRDRSGGRARRVKESVGQELLSKSGDAPAAAPDGPGVVDVADADSAGQLWPALYCLQVPSPPAARQNRRHARGG
jgi:hypothetical protein